MVLSYLLSWNTLWIVRHQVRRSDVVRESTILMLFIILYAVYYLGEHNASRLCTAYERVVETCGRNETK